MDSAHTSFASKLLGATRSAASGFLEFASKAGVAIFALKEIASAAISVAQSILAPNAQMEQMRIAFTTLLGSSQAAGAYLKDLWAFAARTPFQFPELVSDAQQMMAFGFAAGDVIPTLTDIGDAMSAMGRGQDAVAQVVLAFGQMHAAGKLNAEDMLQLTSVGIPAWQILADSMGLSTAEVQKMTTAGLIPADDAIARLRAGMHATFGGAMQAQALTFNGLLSTFKDNIQMAWINFTGPLFEQAKTGLITLGNLVSSPAFQQFATDMGERVGSAISFVTTLITTEVIPAFQQFGAFISTNVIPVVQQSIAWFGSLSPLIAYLAPLFAGLGDAALRFGTALFPIVAALSPLFAAFGQWLVQSDLLRIILTGLVVTVGLFVQGLTFLINGLTAVVTFFTTAGSNAQWLWNILAGIGGFLATTFAPVWSQLVTTWQTQLAPAFSQLGAAFGRLWAALQPLAPVFQFIGSILLGLVVIALGLLVGVIGGVVSALAGLLSGVIQAFGGIVQIISGAVQVVVGIMAFLLDFVTGNWGQLWADTQVIWQGIWTILSGIWNAIMGLFNGAVNFCFGLVSGFISGVIGFFQNLYNTLIGGSIVPDLINGIIAAFTSLPGQIFGIVAGLVSGVIGQMVGWATDATGQAASLVSGVIGQISLVPGQIGTALAGAGGAITTALSSAATDAYNAGVNIVSNIASGIANNVSSFLGNAMSTVGNFIADHLPHSPAKLGPLRYLSAQGEEIPAQISRGILAGLPQLAPALASLSTPIAASATPAARAAPYIPPGTGRQAAPAPIIITLPDIVLDGQRLTRAQMPYITSGIRLTVGGRI